MAGAGPFDILSDDALGLVLRHLLEPLLPGTLNGDLQLAPGALSKLLSPSSRNDVSSFRLVNRRFNHVYTLRFEPLPSLFHRLPRRALDLILDHLLGQRGAQFGSTARSAGSSKARPPDSSPRYLGLSPRQFSQRLSLEDLRNVLHFRLVSKRSNETYKLRFGHRPPILSLPSEIHDIILGFLVNTNTDGKLMPIERKASLSVESFALQLPSAEDSNLTANYRLVCRQFAERALRCQFTRVWIRFSDKGFERLRFVAERPHLARTVRQFSYMIPRFYYQEGQLFNEIINRTTLAKEKLQLELQEKQRLQDSTQPPSLRQLQTRIARFEENEKQIAQTKIKAREQESIITQRRDFNGLLFALAAFVNLEQIRFMKIVDQVDVGWMKVIEQYPDFREHLNAEWNHACEHSAQTLTEALILSNARNFQRLSSRFMDPATPLSLTEGSFSAISKVAKRLKSLELEFDNRWNLDEKVTDLSALFRLVFGEAISLENLHVGFRRLVSVPIGTIFHDVKLAKLSYLGLHQWELESQELVDLLLRYRHIKYLRLRYIRLRRGSWARVLKTIRLNLTLSWISLRGISYPGDVPHPIGMLPPALHHGPDESDDDSDSEEWTGSESDDPDTEESDIDDEQVGSEFDDSQDDNDTEGEGDGDDEDEDEGESDDEESVIGNGAHVGSPMNSVLFPVQDHNSHNVTTERRQPTRRSSHAGQCHCYNGYAWDKLDDNRTSVQEGQWKRWQKWVLKPCRLHDFEASRIETDSESEDEVDEE